LFHGSFTPPRAERHHVSPMRISTLELL